MAVCAERSVNTRICAELVLKIRISVSASTSVEERIDDLPGRELGDPQSKRYGGIHRRRQPRHARGALRREFSMPAIRGRNAAAMHAQSDPMKGMPDRRRRRRPAPCRKGLGCPRHKPPGRHVRARKMGTIAASASDRMHSPTPRISSAVAPPA